MESEQLTARERAGRAVEAGEVTAVEAILLKWQWGIYTPDSFYGMLWAAMVHADEAHLDKLELGFPDEVMALRLWRTTWIAKSLRERGLL